ncbi:hypothetical protein Dimus_003832 [Dionaea muscipula]
MIDIEKNVDPKKKTQFNEFSQPIQFDKSKFVAYLGTLARLNVDINIDDLRHVPNELKDYIWEKLIDKYDVGDEKKNLLLSCAGKYFKDFRMKLICRYIFAHIDALDLEQIEQTIASGREPMESLPEILRNPPQKYDFISQALWYNILRSKLMPEFIEKRKAQSRRSSMNTYPHRMGYKGYLKRLDDLVKRRKKDSEEFKSDIPHDRATT